MKIFRQQPAWQDGECRLAALGAGLLLLGLGVARLDLIRCPWKILTGLPCATCGGTRALQALLAGNVTAALRLQPLITMMAVAAVVWTGYAVAGAWLGLPRVRVQASAREKIIFLALAAGLILANWWYLIMDGR